MTLRRLLVASAVALTTLVPAGTASADAPSVRLVAASPQVTLYRGYRSVPLDLGVWAASAGGAFELRVSQADYDQTPTAVQVDADTGAVLRTVPGELLARRWAGLSGFLRVRFAAPSGRIYAKLFPFCPGSFDQQRLDDTGPVLPTYPNVCTTFSPFTKGMVWGIDPGWAVNPLSDQFGEGDGAAMNIPDGTYAVTVRVMPPYDDLFAIPADNARVGLTARVVTPKARHPGGTAAHRSTSPAPDGPVPTITNPDPATLPDLVGLPGWRVDIFHHNARDYLAFAATEWNAGPAPLVVEGFRRPGTNIMDAYQYFRDAQGTVVGRASVGAFDYDVRPGHEHWHFEQFARYSLYDLVHHELVRSKKQGFCIFPTDAIDLTVPGAAWQPWSFGLFSVCGTQTSMWVREDLDVGWGDTYFQFIPGQSFNVTALPNGWYKIRIRVNPLGALYETSTTNDVQDRLVYLGGRPGARTVLAAPWHGIDP
ncbi:MAG: hypothetical protein E6G67_03500 [Actinobacteria bacterium]|nr:MAG: hypothetical protein E6G67_03500 [Actinomycetota bacterium]